MKSLYISILVIALACSVHGQSDAVVTFCKASIGRHVGDGQCASLAAYALANAGAAGRSRDFPAQGDYVWGAFVTAVSAERAGVRGLETLPKVRAGDIIQMRNVLLEGRRPSGVSYWMRANHHTAVVESVNPARGSMNVLHQNWNRSAVRRDTFILGDLKSGWLRIYRPVKKP
jgi:hypothetical protein